MLDILIRNGWIADGTGNPTYPTNVAIEGDRIVDVGRLEGAEAARTIDATGKIVCPGFIDTHSHSDRTLLPNPEAQSTIRQGITTEIVGNCGGSIAPLTDETRPDAEAGLRRLGYEGPVEWSTTAEFFEQVERTKLSCNSGWLVGHNTVRFAAGLIGAEYTEDQMRIMQGHVREAMEAGALGMSTGLEFEPGRRATTEEVVQLAQVVGEFDGYYASHIRNRAKFVQSAIEEFMDIVRRSNTRGQVSHLNVRYNTGEAPDAWQRAVATMEQTRREGWDVAADCTPFQDGGGGPMVILPDWVMADGKERAIEYLSDPETRMQLRGQTDRYWAFIYRGDFDRVRISGSDAHPELIGKNLVQIGEMWGKHPWDVLFDLFVMALKGEDRIRYIGRLFTEQHVIDNITHPLFNLSVDASTVSLEGPMRKTYMHPLPFAGMIHFITWWVREKHVLRLEEAIRKMTSMCATRFGLRDRGQIRPGAFADVVVFDYDGLDEVSTIEQPLAYCKGVEYVLVNGQVVIDGGEHTGARPGRILRYS
jgi:N-acyl-D-amino-acid deacylase